jgi:hypothetical protein
MKEHLTPLGYVTKIGYLKLGAQKQVGMPMKEHWAHLSFIAKTGDALLNSLLDPLEGLGMLNCGKLELGAALDF